MKIGPRYVAPAGVPFAFSDLGRWAAHAVARSGAVQTFERHLRERFDLEHVALTSSGRAGLTLVLRALRRLAKDERNEVVLPSYTCFTVAAAIVKAGLRPRIADISPATLDFDYCGLANADLTRVLAIVATNLYGLPNDMCALEKLVQRHGVFLIDDAAQAMGGRIDARWCGTFGDAGVFSFGRGKSLSSGRGGAVLTRSPRVARALRTEMATLSPATARQSGLDLLGALAAAAFLRPSLYWIPNAMPWLGLGRTVYSTDFSLATAPSSLAALGYVMADRLDDFVEARAANAAILMEAMTHTPGVRTIAPTTGAVPSYVRFPILIDDCWTRARVLAALRAAGIGGSGSYPSSIADIPALHGRVVGLTASTARCGRRVAESIVTLPTHGFVTPSDLERTIDAVAGAVRTSAPAAPASAENPICVE
jgi:dTDP-4-amino-4,6-dideoxygalactose transaminase